MGRSGTVNVKKKTLEFFVCYCAVCGYYKILQLDARPLLLWYAEGKNLKMSDIEADIQAQCVKC